ncbi:MAG TPA: ComF family protein, partial [Limnochordia bacterium]|nr:ComF family protein [Limnochordia bacterium]
MERGAALAIFDGQLRQLIHRVKFQGDRDLARGLGQLLAERVRQRRWATDLVVPIPLDAGRLRLRGYNHAESIAQPVAAALGRPLAADAVVRVRAAKPQSGLDLRARRENLRGVFWAPEAGRIRNQRVLLIDDVATSGST